MQLIYIYEVALKLLPNPTTSHESYYTDTSIRTPQNIAEGRNTAHDTTHDMTHRAWGKYEIWTKTVPMIVRMRCLTKHDQSKTKRDNELFCLAGFTYLQQITARATEAKGKRTFEEMVPEHYRDFAKVFSEEESQRLPQHQSWDHAIDFEPGAVTHWKVCTYPMAPLEQEELDKFLAEHLEKGYIELSTSPMSSPVFFIRKADGRYCLVQDYRCMNKITIKNKTPLPLAADIINRLTGAQYFTKFDVRWGYHNIRI
jgi:hypothetical protein